MRSPRLFWAFYRYSQSMPWFCFLLVWGMVKCCRGKYPRWQHGLWLLILLRLVLPPDMAVPWSVSHLIRSLTPHTVSRPFLGFPYASPIFQDHQKPLAASLTDTFMPDGQNPSGDGPDNRQQTCNGSVPNPTEVALPYYLLCVFYSCHPPTGAVSPHPPPVLEDRRQAKTVQDPAVLDIIRTWRRRLHIRRTVEVKAVASDGPPIPWGFFGLWLSCRSI
jgi:hypothetical protein